MKQPPDRASKFNLVALTGLALLVVVAAGVALFLILNKDNSAATPPAPTKATGYQPALGTPSVAAPSSAATTGQPSGQSSGQTTTTTTGQPISTSAATTTTTTAPTSNPTTAGQTTGAANTVPNTTAAAGATSGSGGGAVDERFGLIITELAGDDATRTASLNRMLELSQARWWYQYTTDRPSGVNPQARQIYMIRAWHGGINNAQFKEWTDFIRQTGRFDKPTYWLIGNEPNTPGQDDANPEVYAEVLHEANRMIRAADPQATIIGPNTLNFDDTCKACPGFTSGHAWLDALRKVYQARYGSELPFDAWSIHTYNLDWDHLPLIDQAQDIRQLEAFRTYLDSTPATKGKPIWLTEFGVIWGYDGLEWQKTAAGGYTALPRGTFRQDLIEKYLNDTLSWLDANAARLKINRWFVFTSFGGPESFSETFGGIALFDSNTPTANLTAFGRIYTDRLKRLAAR